MAARRINGPDLSRSSTPPATTPEGRENQLVALAVDRAEQQIRDGTVSAQVLTHYLKLGSSREKLEQTKITYENELLLVKAKAVESAEEMQKMYGEALTAMRRYGGQEVPESTDDRYDD